MSVGSMDMPMPLNKKELEADGAITKIDPKDIG